MSSFENNSDTDMQHDETHTQSKSSEGTQEISRGKLIQAIQDLQKKYGVNQQN